MERGIQIDRKVMNGIQIDKNVMNRQKGVKIERYE